jgi:hypothetical protein
MCPAKPLAIGVGREQCSVGVNAPDCNSYHRDLRGACNGRGAAVGDVYRFEHSSSYSLLKDYSMTILSDACADPKTSLHEELMTNLFSRSATVLTVDQWIASLRG